MTSTDLDGPATPADDRYQALLAVSAAIIAHRDLSALFQEMAGRLRPIVHFDHLSLVLHEAATNTMRVHLLEPSESFTIDVPLEERPAGLVWQTQRPLITSRIDDFKRWPRLMAHVQSYGVKSSCWLPLTTARRRLGTLGLTSKRPSNYDTADVGFLQHVANQVAAPRRDPATGAPFHPAVRTTHGSAHRDHPVRGHGRPGALPLAGQRPRAPERHRALGYPLAGAVAPGSSRRPAACDHPGCGADRCGGHAR